MIFEMNKSTNKNASQLGGCQIQGEGAFTSEDFSSQRMDEGGVYLGGFSLVCLYMRVYTPSLHVWINTYSL